MNFSIIGMDEMHSQRPLVGLERQNRIDVGRQYPIADPELLITYAFIVTYILRIHGVVCGSAKTNLSFGS